MSDIVVKIVVDSSQARTATTQFNQTLNQTKKTVDDAGKTNSKYNKSLQEMALALRLVQGPLGGVASRIQTVNQIFSQADSATVGFTLALAALAAGTIKYLQIADKYSQLNSRLALVTTSTRNLNDVQKQLFDISQSTRSELDATINSFTKFSFSLEKTGIKQNEIIRFTDLLNKSFRIGGATAREQSSVLLQLAQAFSKGKLDGDEFRSVLENNVIVAKLLADQLAGGNVGALRAMSKAGQLSAKDIVEAFLASGKTLDDLFKQLPINASQGFTKLNNAVDSLISKIDSTLHISQGLGSALSFVADNLDVIIGAIATLGVALATRLIPGAIGATVAVSRFNFATLAMIGNMTAGAGAATLLQVAFTGLLRVLGPIGLGIAAIGVAFTAYDALTESTAEKIEKLKLNTTDLQDPTRRLEQLNLDLTTASGKYIAKIKEEIKETENLIQKRAQLARTSRIDVENQLKDLNLQDRRADSNPLIGGSELLGSAIYGSYSTAEKRSALRTSLLDSLAGYYKAEKEANDALAGGTGDKEPRGGAGLSKDAANYAQKLKESNATMKNNLAVQKALNEAAKKGADEYEKVKLEMEIQSAILQKINSLEDARHKLTTAQKLEIAEQIRLTKTLDDSTDKILETLKKQQKAAQDLSDNLRDGIADAIEGGLNGSGKGFFQGFFDTLKQKFRRSIAEGIAEGIQTTVLNNVIGAAVGLATSSAGISSNKAGGTAGLTNGFSLASAGSNVISALTNGLNTPFLNTGSIANIGQTLGLSTSQSGQLLGLSKSFTPGNALGGFAGNFLGNSLLGGNRGIGADIGGTLGGIAGSILIPIPVVGSFVGSFLGNAIGGLFGGGKPSSKLQTGNVDLASGEILGRTGLTGKKFSQENFDAVTSLSQVASQLANAIAGPGGLKDTLTIAVGSRNGFGFNFSPDDPSKQQDFKTAGEFIKGITEEIIKRSGAVADALTTALGKIDFTDAEKALADVAFAISYDKLGEAKEETSALDTALADLNKQFDAAAATAKRLGLEESKVEDARNKQLGYLREQFNNTVFADILSIQNPGALATIQEIDRYKQQLKDVKSIGGDLQQVELLHKLRLLQIEQQYNTVQQDALKNLQEQASTVQNLVASYQKLSESLGQALINLQIGNLSTLSPEDKLNVARTQFNDLSARAALGDVSAGEQLDAAGKALLELSKSFYASSTGFAADFDLVKNGLQAAKDTADRQLNVQAGILAGINQQITVTQTGFSDLSEQIKKLTAVNGFNVPAGISENYAGGGFSASNPNEIVLKNLDAIKSAGLYDSVNALLAQFTPGVVVGGGRRSAFFESNPLYASQFMQAAKANGIPGFASGGMIGSGRLAMVGENGPELIRSDRPVYVQPMGGGANDNSPTVNALYRLIQAGAEQTMLLAGELGAMGGKIDNLTRTMDRANERRR